MGVVREMNKKEDTFALLSDITSTIGIGDILAWTPDGLKVFEIKEDKRDGLKVIEIKEGKIAQEIIQENTQTENFTESNKYETRELYENTRECSRSFYKQIARQERQLERMGRFEKIRLTDQGIDPISGQRMHVVELGYDGEHISSAIGHLIENPPEGVLTNSIPLLLSTDCYIVGVTGLHNISEFVRRANFQHAIYHLEQVPWENCDYVSSPETRSNRNLRDLEPQVYLFTQVENLRDSIFVPTHCPLYLLIGETTAMKLIFGEISVFIRFYPERFRDVCRKLGIETRWVNENRLNHYIASTKLKKINFAKFPNGYLELKFKNSTSILSTSMFYSMIYELETGRSIALKIKDYLCFTETFN